MALTSRIASKTSKTNLRVCGSIFRRFFGGQNDGMKSSHENVQIPKINLVEFAMQDFSKFPDRIATECAMTGRKYTFNELNQKSINLNRALRKHLKLQRGDVLAVLLPNVPEYPICIFGAMLAGLRLTTINPSYTAEEIHRQLADVDAKAVITLSDNYGTVTESLNLMKKKLPVVIVKTTGYESLPSGAIDFHELSNSKIDIPDTTPLNGDEPIFIPYSSGTTGLPKGVLLTNDNLVANISQINQPAVKFFYDTTKTHQDVISLVLPMFHIYGFTVGTLSFLRSGVKLVTLPKFSAESFLESVIQHRPTMLTLVPPLVIFMHSHPAVKKEHFENLRTVVCGAAPLGKMDEDKFRKTVGRPINVLQGYGLTESSGIALTTPIAKEGLHHGTLGHPLPNTAVKVVKIEDPELKHLGPNEIGELLIKGPQMLKGYYNRPEETKNAFTDGWFRTGDMVRYDENEFFYIVDRIKELIKVKGLQVAPAELEEIIRSFPGVAEAAVIGIPHEYSGEVPKAYVVAKPGARIDGEKLQEFVASKVARHKKLAGGVAVVNSIPKSASGKILRRQLKLQNKDEGC